MPLSGLSAAPSAQFATVARERQPFTSEVAAVPRKEPERTLRYYAGLEVRLQRQMPALPPCDHRVPSDADREVWAGLSSRGSRAEVSL
jgi:hypothetical protein